MKSNFSVDFFSDDRYEYMTAEISYGGQILCQINQDKGEENMEVEFFPDQRIMDRQPEMKFSVSEFVAILDKVKSELSGYR